MFKKTFLVTNSTLGSDYAKKVTLVTNSTQKNCSTVKNFMLLPFQR